MDIFLDAIHYKLGDILPIDELPEFENRAKDLDLLKTVGHQSCSVYQGSAEDLFAQMCGQFSDAEPEKIRKVDTLITTAKIDSRFFYRTLLSLGVNDVSVIEIGGSHCCSTLTAIKIASSLIKAGRAENVLLLTCDVWPNTKPRGFLGGFALFGDGATSCLISKDVGAYRILDEEDIVHWKLVKSDPNRDFSERFPKLCYEALSNALVSLKKKMSGRLTFANSKTALITVNVGIVAQTQHLGLGVPVMPAFVKNIERTGHILCGDYLLNLRDYSQEQAAQPVERILLVGTGMSTATFPSQDEATVAGARGILVLEPT
ncbi:hypothetical protein [Bradyrhizobium prioriisuperbiae]|uniref:hypothetical protein n=1 Tax=Bradyrhizobium prioriisuperbiae TaxID=2854389 RepID=UPI0028EDB42E|nr:hypothetical protein [Bradyrhizobium prioritasuperba]